VPRREDHRAFITLCYHGGVNLTAYSGATELGVYTQFDLVSCHTTAMVGVKTIDFNNPRVTTNPHDFGREPGSSSAVGRGLVRGAACPGDASRRRAQHVARPPPDPWRATYFFG